MSSQADADVRAPGARAMPRFKTGWRKAVRLYAERAAESEGALPAFPSGAPMTATEVMVTVTAMLKAVNLQVFELGMWQAWSGR